MLKVIVSPNGKAKERKGKERGSKSSKIA